MRYNQDTSDLAIRAGKIVETYRSTGKYDQSDAETIYELRERLSKNKTSTALLVNELTQRQNQIPATRTQIEERIETLIDGLKDITFSPPNQLEDIEKTCRWLGAKGQSRLQV